MTNKVLNKLAKQGIELHHITESYIAFTLNGWKYVKIPIHYTDSMQSILNYLKY